jgi:hypothetical protein
MNALSIAVFRRWRRVALALAFVSALGACGGGAEVLVIPLFTFGFSTTSGTLKVDFFFNTDPPATATGTFSSVNANVIAADLTSTSVAYEGTWSNCTLKIALKQGQTAVPPLAATYDGQFSGVDRIVLTPPASSGGQTLTLQRQGSLTSSFDC